MATDTAQLVTDLQQAIYDLHDPCADEDTFERIITTIKAAMGALVDLVIERDRLRQQLDNPAHDATAICRLINDLAGDETLPELDRVRDLLVVDGLAEDAYAHMGYQWAVLCQAPDCDNVVPDMSNAARRGKLFICAECAEEADSATD